MKNPIRAVHSLPITRIGAFAALPALGAVTPLVALPALTAALGASGWASIAIGQAVGTFAMLIVGWGWAATGPPQVPSLSRRERAQLYTASVVSRVAAVVVAAPIAGAVSMAMADSIRLSSAITAVGFTLWGLVPSWFFVGTGEPVRIAVYETVPKLLSAVATIAWLKVDRNPNAYGLCAIFFAVLSCSIAAIRIGERPTRATVRAAKRHLYENLRIVGARTIGSSFTTLSIPLAALTAPEVVAQFAGAERFRSFMWMATNSVSTALVGWAFEPGQADGGRHRRLIALRLTAVAGACAGAGLALFLPICDTWLFSGSVTISPGLALVTGTTTAVVAVSISLTYHFLAPTGDGKTIIRGATTGAAVGVPMILLLSRLGPTGSAVGVLAAETASMLVLAIRVRRHYRHEGGSHPATGVYASREPIR